MKSKALNMKRINKNKGINLLCSLFQTWDQSHVFAPHVFQQKVITKESMRGV